MVKVSKPMPVANALRIGAASLVFLAYGLVARPLFAQANFELVSPSDIETFKESAIYVPDVKVHGDFSGQFINTRGSLFNGDRTHQSKEDYHLRFESVYQTKVSLVVSITNPENAPGSFNNPYVNYSNQSGKGENYGQPNPYGLVFDQAYLNYHFIPLVDFKIGLQELNLADREGLVYLGKNLAITQTCGIGTWCYQLGVSQNGPAGNDSFRFVSLLYPIFQDGEQKEDFWGKPKFDNRLDFELYETFYNQYKAPLALYGGTARFPYLDTTADYSPYQVTNGLGQPIVRDMNWRYWGFNADWQYESFRLLVSYVSLSGSSYYYSGQASTDPSYTNIQSVPNSGSATYIQTYWSVNDSHKLGLHYLYTTGNKQKWDATVDTPHYARTSGETAFYEVNKGTFGDANIYFNGYNGLGEGHSVSNLTYLALTYNYISKKQGWGWDNALYYFHHSQPVFNANGGQVTTIGWEADSNLHFPFTTNLDFWLKFSLFQPGSAYSINDNLLPTSPKPSAFSAIEMDMKYKF